MIITRHPRGSPREQREASKKDATKKSPSQSKRPVEAEGLEGRTKKRRIGKKERAKLKKAAASLR